MTRDSTDPTNRDPANIEREQPELEHFDAALTHVDDSVAAGRMAAGAAKGILYSIIETLGTLVGDPDLPSHARSGYEGLLETARELRARVDQ
ncbi:major surface protein 3 [Caballeronia choica]|uniref:Major surface protein 3 n=1 Tax=Caballeronia choica TaxID=326476 RepID=A0A158KEC3_9BURK|nr:hypothetical protein [Caballeronia choica]SAL79414.1 major surface protein 3 [Caballeronia choica]